MAGCSFPDLTACDGLWDSVKAAGTVAGRMVDVLPLNEREARLATTLQKTTSVVVFPQLATKLASLAGNVEQLASGNEDALKPTIMDGLSVAGNACDVVVFLNDCGVIKATKAIPVVGAIADALTVVTDGSDIIDEVNNINEYQTKKEKAVSEKQKDYYDQKSCQSCLRIIKKVLAVALAVFALLALIFTSLASFGGVLLAASVVYLIFTVGEYFYSRILEGEKKVTRSMGLSYGW